ncbi:MAG: FAD-dependent oxidoreductase [Lachnospiraceae bacterium]|nr:FAD-dependent oxidoreductase [Lachnospiraceae bacterium]
MKSIWQKEVTMPEFPTLQTEIKTEVLIIGGGIAGLLTAYFLKQEGVDCVLVEKNRICSGTTGHTTAKITLQHGLIYDKLLNTFGRDRTWQYLQANKQAVEQYGKLCEGIDCNFERKDNFVYSRDDREKLEKEMKAFYQLGYDAELYDSLPLPMETVGAVCCPNQAQFQPLKFLSALVKDLNIYEHTFVGEMIGNTAVTKEGRINADKVIVTTHFPFINKHGSYFLKMYQHRSYVLALASKEKSKADLQVDGMYVDEDKTGMSFRNYGDILLLGGGGHRTGKKGGNWEELRQFAEKHYAGTKELCAWAAQDCMTLDDVPYIGRYSGRTKDLYVATGFNKWGMTGAMVSARLLCDMVTEKENDFQEVFSPSRSIVKPQLFVNTFEAVTNLLTITPKRCPHLGCALKWNKAEQTWDCACHGSRFSKEGKVLDNPANGD